MIPISFYQICRITKGYFFNKNNVKINNLIFHAISTDSRTITPGCLFIALIGKNFDAHNFVYAAMKKGATAVVLEKKLDIKLPQIVVQNTTLALGNIAFWIRQQSNASIIALTGSSGKTSVKEITTSILQCYGKTLSTFKNFNNNIGVPLTLLNLDLSYKYAVIEIGANHPKEILYATKLTNPNIALINNIYYSHLDGFKSLLGISKSKQEILCTLPKTGTAIFNADSHHWSRWKKNINSQNIIWFSIKKKSQFFASNIVIDNTGSSFILHSPNGVINVNLPLLGFHNISNALAAAAIAITLNIPLQCIQLGLSKIPILSGRLETITLSQHKTIINDTYNANVASMIVAIKVLENMPGYKIFVSGDMSELGKMSTMYHKIIGNVIYISDINEVMSIGKLSKSISINSKKGNHYTNINTLIKDLTKKIFMYEKITILIKGSRSENLERIVKKLVEECNYD
ncbi:MAG: UDP-N-acetylmuramoyl-tripeptide--D-alanyl-D-alanine ligase [Buchnera aphidicola (Meitanaphis flavogallis)]